MGLQPIQRSCGNILFGFTWWTQIKSHGQGSLHVSTLKKFALKLITKVRRVRLTHPEIYNPHTYKFLSQMDKLDLVNHGCVGSDLNVK